MRCPSCGAEQPDTELVCMECNNYLNLSEDELDRVERYRLSTHTELLCVMFCDISGFTTIANLSLSESQRILALHNAIVTALVERDRAGEIVNTAGDGILVVFANPASATECALRIHEAVYRYYQGILLDLDILSALQARGLKQTPGQHDMPHHVHVGLHLGIVTRGGRTSRDVFGHNVNIACRICDLGGPGQTYLSPPVYDNARLIIGDREELQWANWEELPIRGIASPLTVWGVVQKPYNHLTSPRGITAAKKAVRMKVPLALAAAGLLLAVVIGGVVGMLMIRRNNQSTAAPAPVAARMTLPGTGADEQTLQPIYALVIDASDLESASGENGATAPSTPTGETPAATEPNATASATTQPPVTQPEKATPTTAEESPVAPPTSDPEIKRYFPLLIKNLKKTPIELSDGQLKATGAITVIRGKTSLLIAVGIDEKAPTDAHLALLLDGNNDGKLNSVTTDPFLDLLVNAAGPGSDAKPDVLALKDGESGDPLPAIPAIVGRAVYHGTGTVWIFRVPYDELGITTGSTIKFRLDYTSGKDALAIYHPPSQDGKKLRDIMIP